MNLRIFHGYKLHDYLHILGLSGIAVGLVFGKAILSISLLFSLLHLLVESDFKSYWKAIVSSRLIQIIALYLVFHFISLLWSENLGFGLHDIKVRTSLLLILLVFILRQPDENGRRFVLNIYVASVLLATCINYLSYVGVFGMREYDDIRGMSLFGSHVRFALIVVFAIVAVYAVKWTFKFNSYLKIGIILWLAFYTYYSQVLTGYLTLMVTFCCIGLILLYKNYKRLALVLSLLIIAASILTTYLLFRPVSLNRNIDSLPYATAEGNVYYHHPETIQPETGQPAEIMVCWEELEREWNKRSSIPFIDGRDLKNQLVQTTLIRYLASKGLNKDAEGVKSLSDEDVINIENGLASQYTKGFLARWYSLRYQLLNNSNPNGHSLLERLEYWKIGSKIAKSNLFFGVGIGDIQSEFDKAYVATGTELVPDNRKRTHNMFLTTLITMGIPGLFLFLWFHMYYFVKSVNRHAFAGAIVVILLFVSYLTEDTLETQVGVSIAAFFFGIFNPENKKNESSVS